MGPSVARQTSRKKVENGVLIIQLDSSVVRKELLMVKAKIVSAINEHVGRSAIKDLHIF
jgi:predicted nucleic acid-binding Zn ribbon protein